MTRFEIIGKGFLDIKEDTKMQYQKENILFSFDDIKCDRTISFDVPKTANNDAIFDISSRADGYGNGMRVQYDALLIDGIASERGILYINSYDYNKDVYKCVFLFGRLLSLKTVKELGKLKEIIKPRDCLVYWDANDVRDAGINTYELWMSLYYRRTNAGSNTYIPSVSLTGLAELAARCAGTGYMNFTPDMYPLRILPTELQEQTEIVRVTSRGKIPTAEDLTVNVLSELSETVSVYLEQAEIEVCDIHAISTRGGGRAYATFSYNEPRYFMRGYVVRRCTGVHITFPDDFPMSVTLMTSVRGSSVEGVTPFLLEEATLQEWYFYYSDYPPRIDATGQSGGLAGKTVYINNGTAFAFFDLSMFHVNDPASYSEGTPYVAIDTPALLHNDWSPLVVSFEFSPIVGGEWLYNYLPDLTLVDLAKTIAYSLGYVLDWQNNTFIYERLNDLSSADIIELDGRVIDRKQLKRTFKDYAQNNVVRFDEDDAVKPSERIKTTYRIENKNIEKEKDLYIVPFSEGGTGLVDGDIYVRDSEGEQTQSKEMICRVGDIGSKYLQRVSIVKNDTIEMLCRESTLLELTVRMSYLEYASFRNKTILKNEGVFYVWVDARWTNGVATLSLQKYDYRQQNGSTIIG